MILPRFSLLLKPFRTSSTCCSVNETNASSPLLSTYHSLMAGKMPGSGQPAVSHAPSCESLQLTINHISIHSIDGVTTSTRYHRSHIRCVSGIALGYIINRNRGLQVSGYVMRMRSDIDRPIDYLRRNKGDQYGDRTLFKLGDRAI